MQPNVMQSPTDLAAAQSDNRKGILLALLSIPIGVVLWVVIWSLGYIASAAAFAIAASAVWLYSVGAKRTPSGGAIWALLVIILVGLVLSFMAGVVVDGVKFYTDVSGNNWFAALSSADFWDFFGKAISRPGVWSGYTNDILMSVGFAALGVFGVIASLFQKPSQEAVAPENTAASDSTLEPPKQL